MSANIKGVKVGNEVKKFDYDSLANPLEVDATLKTSGKAADAKVVGEVIEELNNANTTLGESINELSESVNSDLETMDSELAELDEDIMILQEVVSENIENISDIRNDSANALKGNASGSVVRVDDVSPVKHEVAVKVESKNLIAFPYYHESGIVQQGVTITYDENGVITFNGTALADSAFRLINNASIPVNGTYTLSGCDGGSNTTYYLQPFINGKGTATLFDGTRTYDWNGTLTSLAFFFKSGAVFDNVQFKPQLEKSDTATEYTPYVNPESVTVAKCGKNFWNSKNLTYPRTVSGITMDYDPVTQIYTFNGTSTAPGDLYVQPNNYHIMDIKAGETWTLKVEVMGGTIDGAATCSGKMSPLVNTSAYDNTIHANNDALCSTKTFTDHAEIMKMYFYIYSAGLVFDNFKIRVQLEANPTFTGFELAKDLVEYAVDSDGTVHGVTSESPTMTIKTSVENSVVNVEYNQDTNAVIKKLSDAIIALGGTL